MVSPERDIKFRQASLRDKIEHSFPIVVKGNFRLTATHYRGIAKNLNQPCVLFTLSNRLNRGRAIAITRRSGCRLGRKRS